LALTTTNLLKAAGFSPAAFFRLLNTALVSPNRLVLTWTRARPKPPVLTNNSTPKNLRVFELNQFAVMPPDFKQPGAELIDYMFDYARQGRTEPVALYLKDGYTPNVINARGDSLLIIAAYHRHPDLVALLLQQPGIEVDYQNSMGFTALTGATFKGDTEIMQQLISAGANVNHRNLSDQTALMFGALTGRADAVKLLLANGADANAQDQSGKTAAILAAEQGAEEVLKLLPAA
jgi:ankyrin repeat protein